MTSLRKLISNNWSLWVDLNQTIDGRVVSGFVIDTTNTAFVDWLKSSDLSTYAVETLNACPTQKFWVGKAFRAALR